MDDDPRTALTGLLPRLRRFGMALTGTAADADELVQDVCERVLRRSAQLRDGGRLDAWAYGIMRHLWLDRLRARRVRRHEDIAEAAEIMGEDGRSVTDGRAALRHVRRCLEALPAEQRTVLMLVCVDGLTYREAGEVLEIPIGTVMSRMARARWALHERLEATSGGEPGNVVPMTQGRLRSRPV